jgi:fatty-acyl-CoA synthase
VATDELVQPIVIEAPLTLAAQIQARAEHERAADRVFLMQDERRWTYRDFRNESVRMALFLRSRLAGREPGHVAMMLENHLELAALLGGCAFAKLTLFGINTGLRGDVLAGVLNHARARVLVIGERFLPELQRILPKLEHLAPENVFVLGGEGATTPAANDLLTRLQTELGAARDSLKAPDVQIEPSDNLMVIYTSGTTGLPKGINNNHMKLCLTGVAVSNHMGLNLNDIGYACMPLFHSNSLFVGMMPAFWVCGGLAVRERFSARHFVPDVLRYGVTFWNYVGEPVHYVLTAIEREYQGDRERISREITHHLGNHLRYAVGNGASPPDIDRFTDWLGLDDMFELYGSTEAAISTFRRRGDPRGTVGEVTDPAVQILGEDGRERPPALRDAHGKITNYEAAVGEICRVSGGGVGLFQGYFDNPDANSSKVKDGIYHSGDLGHIEIHDGRRFLFFDGRTADWIRKDGENFSAAQVGRLLSEHPDVDLAAAYGVPCVVSDELVMAAIKLRDGASFDPDGFLAWCQEQVARGSMDAKWVPDFVRIVPEFSYTETQKILVRHLKEVHFDRRRLPGEPIYWRRRGDTTFLPFAKEDFDRLRGEFAAAERAELLDR